MAIWAFNKPEKDEIIKFVYSSLQNGISRFGWSYHDNADLEALKNKPWKSMIEKEKISWKKASFLLQIKEDDWIVHINVPRWGECTAVKVKST